MISAPSRHLHLTHNTFLHFTGVNCTSQKFATENNTGSPFSFCEEDDANRARRNRNGAEVLCRIRDLHLCYSLVSPPHSTPPFRLSVSLTRRSNQVHRSSRRSRDNSPCSFSWIILHLYSCVNTRSATQSM
uniref:Uncharacterized protein n=1 Tax=Helianthus annuus TaxID=4232 RepID=A0A251SKZ7_HELAN